MSKLIKFTLFLAILGLFSRCSGEEYVETWQKANEMQLGEFNPIGLALLDSQLWIADSDHNQLGIWTLQGVQEDVFTGFDRPMHIASDGQRIYVPEYGSDSIRVWNKQGQERSLAITDSLDAPAGVDVNGSMQVIADFYNHRILFFDGSSWQSYGTEGNEPGQFAYPTDVQLADGKIYVADAYNNRVQILAYDGTVISVFGKEHGMNGATGVYVSTEQIFVTDFENDRLLIFDKEGLLVQTIDDIEKPTDAIVVNHQLYVASYAGKKLVIFDLL